MPLCLLCVRLVCIAVQINDRSMGSSSGAQLCSHPPTHLMYRLLLLARLAVGVQALCCGTKRSVYRAVWQRGMGWEAATAAAAAAAVLWNRYLGHDLGPTDAWAQAQAKRQEEVGEGDEKSAQATSGKGTKEAAAKGCEAAEDCPKTNAGTSAARGCAAWAWCHHYTGSKNDEAAQKQIVQEAEEGLNVARSTDVRNVREERRHCSLSHSRRLYRD